MSCAYNSLPLILTWNVIWRFHSQSPLLLYISSNVVCGCSFQVWSTQCYYLPSQCIPAKGFQKLHDLQLEESDIGGECGARRWNWVWICSQGEQALLLRMRRAQRNTLQGRADEVLCMAPKTSLQRLKTELPWTSRCSYWYSAIYFYNKETSFGLFCLDLITRVFDFCLTGKGWE